MASLEPRRRLIVNADDFGRSPEINQAVLQAHTEGILTTASLMVNEPACAEAVALARAHPRLGVGLHLTLVCGEAALTAEAAPGVVEPGGRFSDQPVRAGWRYFFRRALRESLRKEIDAQIGRFRQTGLRLDHLNGHLNVHLHPTVLELVTAANHRGDVPGIRLTRDRFWLNARLARGRWAYRISHAVIFNLLTWRARAKARSAGQRHTRCVFGLLQNGRVDTAYVLRLLPVLPRGDSELYCHPSLTEFRHEYEALVSPQVKDAVRQANIRLIRYQDL